MPDEKKGVTVKIDAELHSQIHDYIEEHGMTMAEFITLAADNELHPKMKEGTTMANTRTIALQVSEELFQKIKDYLQRNHMTQKEFLTGLIEDEIERDLAERENADGVCEGDSDEDEVDTEAEENAAEDEIDGEDEDAGMTMGM